MKKTTENEGFLAIFHVFSSLLFVFQLLQKRKFMTAICALSASKLKHALLQGCLC